MGFRIVLYRLLDFYSLLIVIDAILSWIPTQSEGLLYDVKSVIKRLVDPYVGLFRRFIPPMGGLDFSPMIALIALQLLSRLIL